MHDFSGKRWQRCNKLCRH